VILAAPIGYVSSDGQQSFSFDVTLELVKTSNEIASGTLAQAQTQFGIGVLAMRGLANPTLSPTQGMSHLTK
jgi:hypothetical protein